MPRTKGFTLIELLVVVAIIAIMAAILFPVFAQVREKGRTAACLSNVRQIATALQIYTTDYDERTPGGCFATWKCATSPTGFIDEQGQPQTGSRALDFTGLWPLTPYIKNGGVFLCPSIRGWNNSDWRPSQGSYASNQTTVCNGRSLAEFEQPANLVGYADSPFDAWLDDMRGYFIHCRIGRGFYCPGGTAASGCTNCSNSPQARTDFHNDGINVVYIDGHAKWSKLSNLTYKQFLLGLAATDTRYNCPISVFPDTCKHPGP